MMIVPSSARLFCIFSTTIETIASNTATALATITATSPGM
jgi:hypothetical protein